MELPLRLFLVTSAWAAAAVSGNRGSTCQLGFFGNLGTCTFRSQCSSQKISRSQSCGTGLVCCEGNRRDTSAIVFPGEVNRRTTRRTTSSTTRRTNLSNSVTCGRGLLSQQVFGGRPSQISDFPFVVSFVRRQRGRRGTPDNFCGGSLLTSRHVLTAAHCFDSERLADVDVRIGLTDVRSREKKQNQANIRTVKIHEKYRRSVRGQDNSVNDIAIVTLDRDIPVGVTKEANTVCLPFEPKSRSKGLLVLGFGATSKKLGATSANRLNAAPVREISRSSCQNKFDRFLTGSQSVNINNDMICAGDEDSDSCSGDSGSALVWLDSSGRWTAGGVVSFGPQECANVVPGVYTRVSSFVDWIKHQIG